ncbi:MAG: hypothetical protein HZA20_00800 [Nitrospirae bacterium]|nr:hypothetical protein [Nitrospirota bacterium]
MKTKYADRMKQSLAMLLVVLLSLSGCATTNDFKSLPKDADDFKMPYSELVEKYPEIKIYEDASNTNNRPLASYLIKEWGEPVDIKTDHTLDFEIGAELTAFAVLGVFPVYASVGAFLLYKVEIPSPHIYKWEKGDYVVKAKMLRPLFYLEGEAKMLSWQWEPKQASSANKTADSASSGSVSNMEATH